MGRHLRCYSEAIARLRWFSANRRWIIGCGFVIIIIIFASVWVCFLVGFMGDFGLRMTHQGKLLLSAVILLVLLFGKKIKRGLGERGRN
jgi:hypothetical protein